MTEPLALCVGWATRRGALEEPKQAAREAARAPLGEGERLLAACAERVHAELHGTCLGAGIELPAFAGRVVAWPDTTFRLPEVAMGLVPGAGGTVSLPRRIGRQRTAWLGSSNPNSSGLVTMKTLPAKRRPPPMYPNP